MNRASELANEAWKLAEAGDFAKSVSLYHEAIAVADPEENDLWRMRGEFASVLAQMREFREAISEYERSLADGVAQGEPPDSTALAVTRYFIANLQLEMGEPAAALGTVEPSISAGARDEALLRAVEAQAHFALGQREPAKVAAERAIALSRTEEQRERIASTVAHILAPQPNSP